MISILSVSVDDLSKRNLKDENLCQWTKSFDLILNIVLNEIPKQRKTNSATCVSFYFTCLRGGSSCPRRRNGRSEEPQSDLHYVQKGGDYPFVLERSTSQELVNQRQQSLQPQERRGRGSNISTETEARVRQTFRLHTDSGQHKQSTKSCTDIWTRCDRAWQGQNFLFLCWLWGTEGFLLPD